MRFRSDPHDDPQPRRLTRWPNKLNLVLPSHRRRKAACRHLAHAGCTAPEIMAISGHSTLSQVQIYIDEVEQERMADAAMNKLADADRSATSIGKP